MNKKNHSNKNIQSNENESYILCQAKQAAVRKFSNWMREVICYNQGEYIQFAFIASQYHKALKQTYLDSPYDWDELEKLTKHLIDYLSLNATKHFRRIFDYLIKHFMESADSRGSKILPRICIKSNISCSDITNGIAAIARNTGFLHPGEPLTNIEDNTGLLYIKTHGKYFYCSDIPTEFTAGRYKNPRLLSDRMGSYHESDTVSDSKKDEGWISCWKKVDSEGVLLDPDWKACYKSSLIIPITLYNNDLEQTFVDLFRLDDTVDSSLVKEGIERRIFGYLCLDHVSKEYFNKGIDVNVGYILADILSMYMITIINYTHVSNTVQSIRNQLPKKEKL